MTFVKKKKIYYKHNEFFLVDVKHNVCLLFIIEMCACKLYYGKVTDLSF